MESVHPRQSPFRSLDSFTSADAAVFSGREEETEEVATRIMAGSTLVVYGPSGVGKTSLLCAGVIPALEKRRGYRVSYVRPLLSPRGEVWKAVGADPEEPLAAALTRLPAFPFYDTSAVDPTPPEALVQPADCVARDWPRTRRPAIVAPHVLILDQLEELFTRFDEPQRRPLWDGLVEVIEDPTVPVRLVFSLREEYLHLLDSAHPRLPSLLDRRFRLRGLAPFGARTAVVRPLVAARIRYEPELVDRCVADLTDVPVGHATENGVVDPLLLQIVFSEVYREADQRDPDAPWLTLMAYSKLGGPAGVFRRHLEELFNRVNISDHLLLKLVLQEMTTAHATKLPTTVSRLSQSGLLAPPAEIQRLLDKLVAASLVRRYDAEPEPWYELIHDRLIEALPAHFASDQHFLRLRYMRELVSQLSKGFSEGMVGAPLLNRQQLVDLVEPFCKYIRFSEAELNLLFRSAVANEHNVTMWRDALESTTPGKSRVVLLEMLTYLETRRSAVASVGVLRVTDPAHRAKCLSIAFFDTDPVIAAAASESLSIVAGAEEAAKIARALRDTSLRPRAQWLLTELTENPSVQAQVPQRALRAARREANRRHLYRHWEVVQRGGMQGLRVAAFTAMCPALVATMFWCIAMAWIGDVEQNIYAIGIAFINISFIALSVMCGFGVGRTMEARSIAVDHNRGWILMLTNPGALGPLSAAYASGTCAVVLVLVQVTDSAVIRVTDTVLVALTLCAVSPVAVLASIGLTELTLPPVRWHRMRGLAAITIRVLSFSWLFAIGFGVLLALVANASSMPDIMVIIAGTVLFGSLQSIYAVSISSIMAELIWKRSQTRSPILRRWLSHVPLVAFATVVILLLWLAPLLPWTPIVEVKSYRGTDSALQQPYSLRTSWTYGRWIRIRNSSDDAQILSLYPVGQSFSRINLILVWPGMHEQWFFPEVTALYSLRQIDWPMEQPVPCSYAIVPLNREGSSVWSNLLELRGQVGSISVREVECRAMFNDGSVRYFAVSGRETDEQVKDLRGESWEPEMRRQRGSTVEVVCNLHFSANSIARMELVVLFEPVEGRCR